MDDPKPEELTPDFVERQTRPIVSDEIKRIETEIRNNMPASFVLHCHKEVQRRISAFNNALNDRDKNQRLFQRLLLLSIVDAYYKGRFDI